MSTLYPITVRHRVEKSGTAGWEAVTIADSGLVTTHTTFLRSTPESVIEIVKNMVHAGMLADRPIEVVR